MFLHLDLMYCTPVHIVAPPSSLAHSLCTPEDGVREGLDCEAGSLCRDAQDLNEIPVSMENSVLSGLLDSNDVVVRNT